MGAGFYLLNYTFYKLRFKRHFPELVQKSEIPYTHLFRRKWSTHWVQTIAINWCFMHTRGHGALWQWLESLGASVASLRFIPIPHLECYSRNAWLRVLVWDCTYSHCLHMYLEYNQRGKKLNERKVSNSLYLRQFGLAYREEAYGILKSSCRRCRSIMYARESTHVNTTIFTQV